MYIVLEGGDGSGKSTTVTHVYEKLQSLLAPRRVMRTREPGGVQWAERARDFIFSPESDKLMMMEEEVLLFAAARVNLLRQLFQWRADGAVVISDRNVWSSLAYQGAALPQHWQLIHDLNHQLCGDAIIPDLVIYLSVPPELGLKRAGARPPNQQNRNDFKPVDYHQQVGKIYEELAANKVLAKEVVTIPTGLFTQQQVWDTAVDAILKRL